MNTKDIPQFDAAFPQKLEDETAYWPGLSKLEYAAIHIAASIVAPMYGRKMPLEAYDSMLSRIGEQSVAIAKQVLAACE